MEDSICHIQYDIQVVYDTTLLVLKQPFSKKLRSVPFVLMINGKPVISCYLLQYGISPSFHIFSWFLSLKGSSNITVKQTQKCNRSSGSIIEAVLLVWPSYVSGITALGLQIPILGLWGWGRSQKLWVLGSVYQDEYLNCFKATGTTSRRKIAFNGTHLRYFNFSRFFFLKIWQQRLKVLT